MSLLKKIINSSILLLIANSIGKLSIFILNVLGARLLEQDVFGQFSMVRNTIMVANAIVSGCISSPATKMIAESKNVQVTNSKITSLIIITFAVSTLSIFLILLFSPIIVNRLLLGEKHLYIALIIGCYLLLAITLSTVCQSIYIGLELYRLFAITSFLVSAVSIPIIFFLIKKYGLNGILIAISAYYSIDFVFKLWFLSRVRLSLKAIVPIATIYSELKSLLNFGSPLLVGVLINSLTFWYARVLVINSDGNFEGIAIFDAAYQWLSVIMILTGATTSVALPMFSKAGVNKDIKYRLKLFKINLVVNVVISSFVSSVLILFSEEIMGIYGEQYIAGNPILIWLCIASIFFTIATVYNRYMLSVDKPSALMYASLIGAIAFFIVLFFSGENSIGLACGYVAYYAAGVVYYIFMKFKDDRISLLIQ